MSASRTVSREAARAPVSSVDEIRGHFPALERQVGDQPVAYFDAPGGTQVPRAVADAMVDYLFHHNANTHWAYPTSAETDAALAHARLVWAGALGADPAEVVFGANMTTLTFHLSRALAPRLGPGDEIVVTELDHHGNVAPWSVLERERGATVRTARMIPAKGQLDWAHLESLIGSNTRLVAMGAASNALGTVSDVRRAVDLAHAVGALAFVDGVHYAPHRLPDVRALDCDFFACSAYKVYGPHVGVLYGKRDLLADVDFPRLIPASHIPPERAETGTLNHEGLVGASTAMEWLASLAPGQDLRTRLETVYGALDARNADLSAAAWQGLASVRGVRLFGPPPGQPRTPTLAFVLDGWPSSAVARRLAGHGLFVSHGDFYAHTVVERLGLHPEGLVRVGCACYSTMSEVTRLVSAVEGLSTSTP